MNKTARILFVLGVAALGGVAALSSSHAATSYPPYVGADLTIESLLGPLQYPVPPGFGATLKNRNYEIMPANVVSAVKNGGSAGGPTDFHPFAAAYRFCQHITPAQPLMPQGVSGKPTEGLLVVGAYENATAASSIAAGACYRAFARRLQAGKNVTDIPASSPDSTAKIATLHDEQAARCKEDANAGILDVAASDRCQEEGRSELQAEHDMAYRRGAAAMHTQYMSQLTASDNEKLLIAMAMGDEIKFEQQLLLERQVVTQAIIGGVDVASRLFVGSSPLSQPTK